MDALPNLAGVATEELVEAIGAGKFSARYINWSRTMALLRQHAPGWLPELVRAPDGGIVHAAAVGGFLLIRFRNMAGNTTPEVPQAIMDTRNAPIALDKITARDITDTHRRGACMAAALTFGLAYELWAKMPLESGYADEAPAHAPEVITAEQVDAIRVWMAATESDPAAFCKAFKVDTVEHLHAANYALAIELFEAKAKKAAA